MLTTFSHGSQTWQKIPPISAAVLVQGNYIYYLRPTYVNTQWPAQPSGNPNNDFRNPIPPPQRFDLYLDMRNRFGQIEEQKIYKREIYE